MQTVLEQDFARIPQLLGSERSQPLVADPAPEPPVSGPAVQLGLF
jgi:hypothetical protein